VPLEINIFYLKADHSTRKMLSLPVRRLAVRLPARLGRHHLHNPSSPPHAYLQPLVSSLPASEASEEFEGVMSLIMDRKETRNALSGRMVSELREGIAKVSADRSYVPSHPPPPPWYPG
jgi:methylglutaconyl-CoA hydratase